MNLEFTLLTTAMKALDKAMEPTPEPRCPKCGGPMNLLRDAHLTRTDGCRKGNLYLCDDPKCNGWEEAP